MTENRKTSVALLRKYSLYTICLCFMCMYLTTAIDNCVTSASRSFSKSPTVQTLPPSVDYLCFSSTLLSSRIRGGADKSLARPGRKQATSTKLGIYSIYSPRSSIRFLAHSSNFCKPIKKNSEGHPSNQVSAAAMTSALD